MRRAAGGLHLLQVGGVVGQRGRHRRDAGLAEHRLVHRGHHERRVVRDADDVTAGGERSDLRHVGGHRLRVHVLCPSGRTSRACRAGPRETSRRRSRRRSRSWPWPPPRSWSAGCPSRVLTHLTVMPVCLVKACSAALGGASAASATVIVTPDVLSEPPEPPLLPQAASAATATPPTTAIAVVRRARLCHAPRTQHYASFVCRVVPPAASPDGPISCAHSTAQFCCAFVLRLCAPP